MNRIKKKLRRVESATRVCALTLTTSADLLAGRDVGAARVILRVAEELTNLLDSIEEIYEMVEEVENAS